MRNYHVKLDYIEDMLFSNKHLINNLISLPDKANIFTSRVNIIKELNELFPNSTDEEKYQILYLMTKAYFRNSSEKIQLIWSGPDVSGLPGRDTELVFEEMIKEAKQSIIISIYSLSVYAERLLKLLKKKVEHGLYVEIYVNDFNSKSKLLEEIMSIRTNRLFIYEYIGATNDTQSLHAKVLSIDDCKAVITSSNLSYNGMEGNLELGMIVNSKEKAKEIRSIFNTLIEKKYFKRIRQDY